MGEIKTRLLEPFRFAGGRRLVVSGGEPTLSADLKPFLEYAVRLGLDIFLATNLYQIEPDLMQALLEILPDRKHTIMVSYDSVIPGEMNAIRGRRVHDDVTSNLMSLLRMKRELGIETKVCASLVLQRLNCRSVADTIGFLLELGVHRIFVQPVHEYGEIDVTNLHLVRPPYGEEALPDLRRAIESIFRLAENEERVRLSDPDIQRWQWHFTDPAGHKGSCASAGFIFVNRCGDCRGCHNSKAYANIREIGLVDFLSSPYYEAHRELVSKCKICIHSCS